MDLSVDASQKCWCWFCCFCLSENCCKMVICSGYDLVYTVNLQTLFVFFLLMCIMHKATQSIVWITAMLNLLVLFLCLGLWFKLVVENNWFPHIALLRRYVEIWVAALNLSIFISLCNYSWQMAKRLMQIANAEGLQVREVFSLKKGNSICSPSFY